MQLNALIVDDEADARNALERLINNEIPEISVVGKADNSQSALEMIIDENPDIVFLDIQMPGNDGFWLAEKIDKLQKETCIIFVTAYDEYAIDAIKHAAFDFLTKPVMPEVLKDTIARLSTKINANDLSNKIENLKAFLKQDRIKLNTHDGFIVINTDGIIYCEAEGNYCKTVLSNGKTELLCIQLGNIRERLNNQKFLRISRSVIINLNYLDSFNRRTKTVVLSDVLQKYEFKASSWGMRKLNDI